MRKKAGTDLLTSPMLQSGALGAIGYGLTDYLYPKITNSTNLPFINSIKDPIERARVLAKYQKNLKSNQSFFRNLAGVLGVAAPMWFNKDTLKRGWESKDKSGKERGLSGGLAAFIGGDSSVENMKQYPDYAGQANDLKYTKDKMSEAITGQSKDYDDASIIKNASENNKLAGNYIDLSGIKPLTNTASFEIPTMDSIRRLNSYPTNKLLGVQNTAILTQGLTNASNGIGAGMISMGDIAKGITRMGFGYGVGKVAGNILGTILSQPVALKDKMSTGTGLAASIANTGILEHLIK